MKIMYVKNLKTNFCFVFTVYNILFCFKVKPAGQILIEEIKILEQKKEHVEDAITNVLKETDELEERLQRCQINKEKFSEAELRYFLSLCLVNINF